MGADGDPWASPGEWLGGLAESMHLAGTAVEREELLLALDGREPGTGRSLLARRRDDRVAAHDLTCSAPSSVSAIWALAPDDLRQAIQEAQDQAVREAFAYVENNLELVRRRDVDAPIVELRRQLGRDPLPAERQGVVPPIIRERAAGLLGAAFAHHTARQTEEQAKLGLPPDPQLHTHVLLLSVAQRQDGQLVAINSLELHRRRAEVAAVYRASLAARLQALGFGIERTGEGGRYFEIGGVPLALRQAWSSRRQEIQADKCQQEELRALLGREPTRVELHKAAARARIPKGRWWRGDLFRWWQDMAASLGVTPATIEQLRQSRARTLSVAEGRRRLIAELLGINGLTHEHATFDLSTLRREAYERAPGLLAADQVEQALQELLRDEQVVEVEPKGVWTTKEMLHLEREVLNWKTACTSRVDQALAAWRQRRSGPAVVGQQLATTQPTPRMVEEALLRCPVRLSDEQREALDSVLVPRFVALTGEAGTGKGVVLSVAADVWRQQGRRVLAIAVGGRQAQHLAADLGRGTEALTLDALTYRVAHGKLRLTRADIVVLDEAGQVDTRRWAALARATGSQATVVAVGDAAQLSSISAGGLWPMLSVGGPRLTDVRRTKLAWEREAWANLRRGESAEALNLYARHHSLHLHDTRAEALQAAVEAWDRDGRDGLIITDASHAERYQANLQAQAARVARGEIGEQAAVSLSTVQGQVRLHSGEPVIFTTQYRRPGLARRVERGTTGTVVAVDAGMRSVRVRTQESSPREIVLAAAGAPLDLYYASHVYKAQGTTVRRSYVVSGGWQTHRESLYVACSRSREGTQIFVNREDLSDANANIEVLTELVMRVQESRSKVAASDQRALAQREARRHHHWRPLSKVARSHLGAIHRALWQQTQTPAGQAPAVAVGE